MSKLGNLGRRLYTGEMSVEFVGQKRRWFIASGVIIAVLLVGIAIRGLNLGIEFTGGVEFSLQANTDRATVQKVEDALADTGIEGVSEAQVGTVGQNTITVETDTLNTDTEVPEVSQALADAVGIDQQQVSYNLIGASWGSQVTERGLLALGIFLVLVSLVLWAYMRNLKMSGAALIALMHDLVVTIGVYALVGFTFTPESLIGLLTILGYSLYDTVVVFDKVRENTRNLTSNAQRTYSDAANLAVNQTFVRSINTTIIGVLPVAALLFAGGVVLHTGPLKDLALALFVGMVSGAYSSLFLATPILSIWKEREPDMKRQAKRVAARKEREAAIARGETPTRRRGKGSGGTATAVLDREDDDDAEVDDATETGPSEGDEVTGTVGGSTVTVVHGSSDGAPRRGSAASTGDDDVRRDNLADGGAKRPQPRRRTRNQRRKN